MGHIRLQDHQPEHHAGAIADRDPRLGRVAIPCRSCGDDLCGGIRRVIACRRTTPLGSTRGFRRTPWVRLRSTDGHCFYAATMRQIDNGDRHEAGRRLNNRAENSHSGASPRCPAPAFPGVHFSNTNSATDTLPSRLPVTTTGRDARASPVPPIASPGISRFRRAGTRVFIGFLGAASGRRGRN